ncbi:hypothetical protein LRD18_02155 [Halorhodospira halochloris]|uniref:Uncharacterized protein n=1 Tax=Halorhodospira halochloris TaxID=1052 RepID=A0A2Z6EZV2_HALHR|nr:hypothetical protein [Halorhodospira halochloris]MBK1651756.1 hypothetical protein [Halorhodospira halochloris]MCG5529677.1 hypothetical protein [Halorhodospira halochloris]MCG5548523.1 hypothetical protein [Halorhodospira halochloris]BBE11129.1 hypothetical protein HH1059_19310 [Halorhodospira halochloris]
MAEEKVKITDERIAITIAVVSAILTILGIAVFESQAVIAVFGGLTAFALFFLVVAYSAR